MTASSTVGLWDCDVEAARYALSRRLVPVLRHHLVVNLQPIGMLFEVAERRIVAGPPDQESVRDILTRINRLSRASVASSLDVMGWLAADDNIVTPLGAGVEDALGMLRSNFTFRGLTVDNRAGNAVMPVVRAAVREVFTAALIAATDTATRPVRIDIGAETDSGRSVVSIGMHAIDADGNEDVLVYRALTWSDVKALARAHGVALEHADGAARLYFREAVPVT